MRYLPRKSIGTASPACPPHCTTWTWLMIMHECLGLFICAQLRETLALTDRLTARCSGPGLYLQISHIHRKTYRCRVKHTETETDVQGHTQYTWTGPHRAMISHVCVDHAMETCCTLFRFIFTIHACPPYVCPSVPVQQICSLQLLKLSIHAILRMLSSTVLHHISAITTLFTTVFKTFQPDYHDAVIVWFAPRVICKQPWASC